ncbi:MAG: hypothetical protein LBC56_00105 [Oscillospiraceae bacterium]|jgi:hypothetical protein|nr:hypothetical protein [Oscillospiraceae bacterium]
MPVSDAKKRANAKYNSKAYDRINIAIRKGRKSEIQALADTVGQSVNAYIVQAIDERMERENPSTSLTGPFEGMGEESPQSCIEPALEEQAGGK